MRTFITASLRSQHKHEDFIIGCGFCGVPEVEGADNLGEKHWETDNRVDFYVGADDGCTGIRI